MSKYWFCGSLLLWGGKVRYVRDERGFGGARIWRGWCCMCCHAPEFIWANKYPSIGHINLWMEEDTKAGKNLLYNYP